VRRLVYPNLEAELRRKGYSREDMAKVLEIHVSGVSAMMTGKRAFSIYRAEKLRNAMFPGMKLDYLFGRDSKEEGTGRNT
jgi:transcriptional regulator with XRE-family HTH domain